MIPRAADVPDPQRASVEETLSYMSQPPGEPIAGTRARRRFVEFFTAQIRNPNTRAAYSRAVSQFFAWCDDHGLTSFEQLEPVVIAAYVEQHPGSRPTVKQHLAALRMLFDWLVSGHVLDTNPAGSVRGPKHSAKRGKTPLMTADQARQLYSSSCVDQGFQPKRLRPRQHGCWPLSSPAQ